MKTESRWKRYQRKYHNDKEDPHRPRIPVVIFQFKTHDDLWLHEDDYKAYKGGQLEVLEELGVEPDELVMVRHVQKYASSFPEQEWEG